MAEQPPKPGPQPMSPEKRRRLQQCFEHGSKSASGGNYDYATELFTQCVKGDPGNLIYTQNFLGNLQKKYNNNKKGSKLAGLKGATVKGSITKTGMQKDWVGVITNGMEMLKLNPWDLATLKAMGNACEQLQFDECQLAYLKLALDVDIADADVNRLNARALGRLGRFDQAIVCWTRVLKASGRDEEASRAIANLTVEKTIHRGGYEDAESSTEVMVDKNQQADRQGMGAPKLTPEQQLEKAIGKDPTNLANYSELADLHLRHDRLEQAEQVLTKALAAAGGEISIRERLEDVQLRRARAQLEVAQKRAQAEKTEEAVNLWRQMNEGLNRTELEVYRSRSDRYPDNASLKFELAVRLQRLKNYAEAIKMYQLAGADTKRKGVISLSLGQCFQAINQFKLAMSNYERAVAETPEREPEQRKVALYHAGRLALYLKNLDSAEKHLTELAGLDFGYKDVATLLDKLNKFRENGDASGASP
ncbi:MAG TPA: tetratricopeptide repeat protein [Pirellulales bacterium]|jgi:tetratricopeptide (TPR) repeat protein